MSHIMTWSWLENNIMDLNFLVKLKLLHWIGSAHSNESVSVSQLFFLISLFKNLVND